MSACEATSRSPNCGSFNDESYLKTKYRDVVDRQLLETVGWAFDCKVAACEIGDVCGEEHTRKLFIG
jgi:hypothetical protein